MTGVNEHRAFLDRKAMNALFTYLSSFKGRETLLLLLGDDQTIQWLIRNFEQSVPFTIGDGQPIESDGSCIARVEINPLIKGSRINRKQPHYFQWMVSRDSADKYIELLKGMLNVRGACHQYLDTDNDLSPVPMVSRGEYEIRMFRDG